MFVVEARITEYGNVRFNRIESQRLSPARWADEMAEKFHLNNADVLAGYVCYDHPSQSFIASQFVFTVKNGTVNIDSLKTVN